MATATATTLDPSTLTNWTTDQESALLRACIQWKPVGMHKHFRMIAIRNQLIAEGLVNDTDPHTSTQGIWQKLGSLYDLPSLDSREDAGVTDGPNGDGDGDEDEDGEVQRQGREYWRDFELPREDFEAMMWERRLAPEGTSSPEMSRRESTVADTDEPRSSPVPGAKSAGRGGRAGARKSGRLSRLKDEVETENESKATSVADEDHTMEDVDEEEEESGSGDDETEEDEQEEATPRWSAKRGGRGGKRGRGRARGRRRG